ncbi:hypothetical protein [Antrihabitans sp. YC2-6]|uniref:hypothetical protein n=1 Tax=Antrihabitans sp. YC2-6 TaxID=2799498 RepID=UPI0018F7B609|nr:hypothetical protein [Antrihabitans sp. YC2-6]MBJ8343938.1 hypothetical protein [Antrihabitans sp. YC2-6]
MSKYLYRNTSDYDLAVIGVGVVATGEVIESDHPVENPNLEQVKAEEKKKTVNKENGDV